RLGGQVGADLAGDETAVVLDRDVPRDVQHLAREHGGLVLELRRLRRRQGQVQFLNAFFRIGRHRFLLRGARGRGGWDTLSAFGPVRSSAGRKKTTGRGSGAPRPVVFVVVRCVATSAA